VSVAAQVLAVFIAVLAVVVIVGLVRAGKLKERFALIWLMVAAGMVVLVLARPLLDRISQTLGIQSGTTTLFLLATLAILGLLLQLTIALSSLEEKVRDVAEAVALSAVEEPDDGKDETRP
jgi:hypothetical protein